MKKLSAEVCAVTHAGRVRKENEDNYSLNGRLTCTGDLKKGSAYVQKMTQPFHLAICDGMGGESYGELASGLAVEAIAKNAKNIYESGEDFSFAIAGTLDQANSKICDQISSRGKRMGTTLAGIYTTEGKIICVSLGDTRIYHYTNGILEQMSFDHTHAQEIVDAGEASQNRITSIPDAKRLTKHLGVFPEEATLSPNISVIDDAETGDIILLCSDGLTDMVSDNEIASILSTAESSQDATGKLIKKALENGGKDNITVISAVIKAEDTAIFTPIAKAIVGDEDTNYEEEYRNSFGGNDEDNNEVSPYANADASVTEKQIDKEKIIKIALISIIALAVLAAAAFMIKAAVTKYNEQQEVTTESTTESTTLPITTLPDSTVTEWEIESLTEESSTEDTTLETSTTKKYVATTKKYTNTTKKRAVTTTRKASTTVVATSSTTTAATTQATTTEATTVATTAATTQATTTQHTTEAQTEQSTVATTSGTTSAQ